MNHSVFKINVRSTRLPLATLKPAVGNDFHVAGGFGNASSAISIGKMTKRGPFLCMNSAAFFEFNGVIQPLTRERKYQTRFGSWKSTAPNSISAFKSARA